MLVAVATVAMLIGGALLLDSGSSFTRDDGKSFTGLEVLLGRESPSSIFRRVEFSVALHSLLVGGVLVFFAFRGGASPTAS